MALVTVTEIGKFIEVYDDVPSLPLERLPEYLVHRHPRIRKWARARFKELRQEAQGIVLTPQQKRRLYGGVWGIRVIQP